MKIDKLETHDRLLYFTQQADYISEGCQDCIKNRPEAFGNNPFYIFAHKRDLGIDERVAIFNQDLHLSLGNPSYNRQYLYIDQVPSTRLIWAPRLTKPKAQTNSMLFKYYPITEVIKVIWILPQRELWEQYEKGKMTNSQIIMESISMYNQNLAQLEAPEKDDLSEEACTAIYMSIPKEKKMNG